MPRPLLGNWERRNKDFGWSSSSGAARVAGFVLLARIWLVRVWQRNAVQFARWHRRKVGVSGPAAFLLAGARDVRVAVAEVTVRELGGMSRRDHLAAVVAHPGEEFVDRFSDRVARATDEDHDRVGVGLDAFDQIGVEREGRPIEPSQNDHATCLRSPPRQSTLCEPTLSSGPKRG